MNIYRNLFIIFLLFPCLKGLSQIHKQIAPFQGITDPHIHIFQNKAYLFAGRDVNYSARDYEMPQWWIWSSSDLVHWEKEFDLFPEDTYMGKMKSCWATDAAERNGKYYWYLSQKNKEVGVVVADQPEGPYRDILQQPLLPEGLTNCHQYDPAVFIDDDANKTPYLLFGETYHDQYHLVKLNEDMISLAEVPRPIKIYGQYRIDDKGFIFKRNNQYYLIFGETYAVSKEIYGPYTVGGKFYGNHNAVFSWHQQDYVVTANNKCHGCIHPFMRGSSIYYLHFRGDGSVYVDENGGYGVGAYDANRPRLEAENFFKAKEVRKVNGIADDFYISPTKENAYVCYPNIHHLEDKTEITLLAANNRKAEPALIEIRANGPEGEVLGVAEIPFSWNKVKAIKCPLKSMKDVREICILFKSVAYPAITLDAFTFAPENKDIKTPLCHWNFENGPQGWQAKNNSMKWQNKSITSTENGKWQITSPMNIKANLSEGNQLVLQIKNNSSINSGELYFNTVIDSLGNQQLMQWSEQNKFRFNLQAHSDWKAYIINLSDHKQWTGKLNQLRLIFPPIKAGSLEISDIQLWKYDDYQYANDYVDFIY
ncbi:family 43 glycosylhydrolase [Persicobacter diffluens]|uniref:Family 43 glycosylhydrolase n=1 Tax=Persicobacter diffluens TaxID=981 RepID=A0AAN4W5C5_9BACT|nr:hypothetical protein PEDI_49370 [Persicobacter diffluens]